MLEPGFRIRHKSSVRCTFATVFSLRSDLPFRAPCGPSRGKADRPLPAPGCPWFGRFQCPLSCSFAGFSLAWTKG